MERWSLKSVATTFEGNGFAPELQQWPLPLEVMKVNRTTALGCAAPIQWQQAQADIGKAGPPWAGLFTPSTTQSHV